MSESTFQFNLSDRVTVPGTERIQGVVTERKDSVKEPNRYLVEWKLDDGADAVSDFSESRLAEANAPPVVDTGSDAFTQTDPPEHLAFNLRTQSSGRGDARRSSAPQPPRRARHGRRAKAKKRRSK